MAKPLFLMFIGLLLLLSVSDAAVLESPLQSPLMSPTLQSPLMSPTSKKPSNTDCTTVVYNLVDCVTYLIAETTHQVPLRTCCAGMKAVSLYNPKCYCYALEGVRGMGYVIDDTKSRAIPNICNVAMDPHCDLSTPNSHPPTTSPSSPKSPPTNPTSPKTTGSAPAPTISSPKATGSAPAPTASSPKATGSSPAATSPALAPSVSSAGTFSVTKLFLAVLIVSSFV